MHNIRKQSQNYGAAICGQADIMLTQQVNTEMKL